MQVRIYEFDVFLSYSSTDRNRAREFVQWLRSTGLRVWIDEEQLIPGSRFRVGLQQGLVESRNMVALITADYHSRPWTQRELDLFDLDAGFPKRHLLGIELDDLGDSAPLDQAFQVHQRIKWNSDKFDPEAFWKLHCGLTNTRPGPSETWARNGNRIVNSNAQSNVREKTKNHFLPNHDFEELIYGILNDNSNWEQKFIELKGHIRKIHNRVVVNDLIGTPWATGHAEFAAIIALAFLPSKDWYSLYPFLDLNCIEICNWYLEQEIYSDVIDREIGEKSPSSVPPEMQFSLAVSKQHWYKLPEVASELNEPFKKLANAATSRDATFSEFDADYNYGAMITPWNHFQLAWLATLLGDDVAGHAHISQLCSTTKLGEVRSGRFLNRLATWGIFSQYREDSQIRVELQDAREALGMIDMDRISVINRRLTEIFVFTQN